MLNIADRNYANDTYRLNQSYADISTRKNKFLSSTGFSNSNNNNLMTGTTRLPQLSRSFSSSSSKSAKLKLTTMDASLSSISQMLHDLRLDTRESRRFTNFLKDDLAERELSDCKNNLTSQINKLEKIFKLSKKNDEDRTKALKIDCDKMRESSNSLKHLLNLLSSKIDKCEDVMGIYSGKEKHRM